MDWTPAPRRSSAMRREQNLALVGAVVSGAVIATGLLELAGVIGLATPRWRRAAGWAFAAYALCVWPANMRHAMLDLSSGTGLPLAYHAPRLLLQPLIIWWALWASGAVYRRQP